VGSEQDVKKPNNTEAMKKLLQAKTSGPRIDVVDNAVDLRAVTKGKERHLWSLGRLGRALRRGLR